MFMNRQIDSNGTPAGFISKPETGVIYFSNRIIHCIYDVNTDTMLVNISGEDAFTIDCKTNKII